MQSIRKKTDNLWEFLIYIIQLATKDVEIVLLHKDQSVFQGWFLLSSLCQQVSHDITQIKMVIGSFKNTLF